MSTNRLAGAMAASLLVLSAAAASTTAAKQVGNGEIIETPKVKQSVSLKIEGAPLRRTTVCGRNRSARVAAERVRVSVRITLADASDLQRAGRRARLLVDRCENGGWRRVRSLPFGTRGRYRRVRRYRLRFDTTTPGDYRVQARVAGDRLRRPARSRAAYLRVDAGGIVDIPVTFRVVNSNRSELPCPSVDNKEYTVRGRLEGPRSALIGRGPHAVTLYLHSPVLAAQTEWRFDPVPGYDYAREQAKAGHASITIDRLGYGDSGLPQGDSVCAGSQADVAHQIVQQLREGDYGSPERSPIDFERVALAGFSGGGLMAEVVAYSFPKDIDALIVIGWAETGHHPGFLAQAGDDAAPCATGGEHKYDDGTGPLGYVYIFKDESVFARWFFTDIEPDVFAAARRAHERDPCGDLESGVPAIPVDSLHLSEISVPVLLVYGADDAVYPFPAPETQRTRFTGSDDVTLLRPPGGHIVMLERTAGVFRTSVSEWLRDRGF